MSSAYRVPVDTAAGGFATLAAMIPWKVLEGVGASEDTAAAVAGALLLGAAVAALAARGAPFAQRQFEVAIYREQFRVPRFLQAFACFALAELALFGGIWLFVQAQHG